MTQKGPELKSSILGRLTSALWQTRGNRPRGVHFWPYIFSRITFSVRICHILCVFLANFDLNLKWAMLGRLTSTLWGIWASQERLFHFLALFANYFNILYSYLSYPECISSTQNKTIFNRLLCRKLANIMRIFFLKNDSIINRFLV